MSVAIINEDDELHRAATWRRRVILMKPEQIGPELGYSPRTIYRFETGLNSAGDGPTPPEAWRCYKMACAGLHARKYGWTKGREFDWKL